MDDDFKILTSKRKPKLEDFDYLGCKIGRGTYGFVYKAWKKDPADRCAYALKQSRSTGLGLSACREVALLKELKHRNIVKLIDVILDHTERKIWLLLEYAEHDLYKIIKFHRTVECGRCPTDIPERMVKSLLYQMLNGVNYLHVNWILHRDLKPANILIMGEGPSRGQVKIADMGFSRLYCNPLKPLGDVDSVVVTQWYRAPELLLGSKDYTESIDIWAIGCIFAEMLILDPLFFSRQDCEENGPYHHDQLDSIFSVLGFPKETDWEDIKSMPKYPRMLEEFNPLDYSRNSLTKCMGKFGIKSKNELALLQKMLVWDPKRRITAEEALDDEYFLRSPVPSADDVFSGHDTQYPKREFIPDDTEESRGKKRKRSTRTNSTSQQTSDRNSEKIHPSAAPSTKVSSRQQETATPQQKRTCKQQNHR